MYQFTSVLSFIKFDAEILRNVQKISQICYTASKQSRYLNNTPSMYTIKSERERNVCVSVNVLALYNFIIQFGQSIYNENSEIIRFSICIFSLFDDMINCWTTAMRLAHALNFRFVLRIRLLDVG